MIRKPAVLVAALVLSACGGETSAPDVAGGPDLKGRTFVATSLTEGGRPHPMVDGTELRLTFRDDQLRVEAGCNHLSGSYEIDGERLTVSRIGGTEMGCPEPLMEQDAWLAEVLAGDHRIRLAEHDLTLTAGDVVIELTDREIVSPDRPLVGTRWVLDSLIEGETVSSVPGGITATLRIDDGRAHLDTGCNELDRDVAVEDATLTFGNGVTTDVDCPRGPAAVEDAAARVLEGETTWQITERSLTITNGDRGLRFRAE